jgi:hypothetical protein
VRKVIALVLMLLVPAQGFAASRFLITGGGSVTWSNSNTAIWSASSGGATGASVPGVGDDVTMDGSSGGGTVTLNYSPTVNNLTAGAYTGTFADGANIVTASTVSLTGSGTRTFNFTASEWDITGASGTVWNATTTTNLTNTSMPGLIKMTGATSPSFVGGSLTYNDASFTGSGAAASMSPSGGSTFRDLTVSVGSSGSVTVGANTFRNVSLTVGTCVTSAGSRTITGNLTISASTSCVLGGTTTLAGTSGTQVVTLNGMTGNTSAWVVNNSGTAVTLDGLSTTQGLTNTAGTTTISGALTTSAVTFTAGALTLNGTATLGGVFTHTAGALTVNAPITSTTYVSNNSNVRSVVLNRPWGLTGTGAVVNITTSTNMTMTCAPGGYFYYTDTSSSSKSITWGSSDGLKCFKYGDGTVTNGWTVNP